LTDDQDDVKQPEQKVTPPGPARLAPHGRSSDEDADETAEDERTSPFPYAEKFGQWVVDETAPGERQRRSQADG
jgi:hypothetical protein